VAVTVGASLVPREVRADKAKADALLTKLKAEIAANPKASDKVKAFTAEKAIPLGDQKKLSEF
jgi:hypothetical protein